ncbi:MAG: helix-turn-helix transcriptional regulator [Labilithrix sp.]|nr:helix-turn-helix transcriptional regulator [Labilithrix sp.]MCW5818113.1 helix-turn-helix transcriptional regulator [Labilithrix sp.]
MERVYAAAVEPAGWSEALRFLAGAVGGTACGFRVESFEVPAVTQTWVGLEPAFERAYVERYWADDVWAIEARRGPVGFARTGDQLVSPKIRKANPFINELCVPYELDDLVGGLVALGPHEMISFAAMKPRGARPFDASHAELFEALIPHMRRALAIADTLQSAQRDARTAWDVVDRLPAGAIVLDARGRRLHLNEAARRMVAAGLDLDARDFREIVATLEPRRVTTSSGAVLAVTAVPLRAEDDLFALANERGRTLVVVTDPSARVGAPAELLSQVYGLTAAEARVALLVGGGLAPKEAADRLGTAWNTVRAQLRHVFAKTGTSGQPALARLLVLLGLAS